MKTRLNQKGYSLLITLMIILLFSILGATLMAMTFNGVAKNETRENLTQTQDLATKGLQKIENQIQKELIGGVPATGYTNSQFETHFNSVINRYSCSANKSTSLTDQQNDGSAKMCISSFRPSPNYPESMTMKELKLKSVGSKGGHDATVYKTVDMGAEDIEKVLNYTVSTLGRTQNGGNLYLHGSSDITGDLNIPGNLFSIDRGYAYINGDRWASSKLSRSLPTPISINETKKSTLNLGGKIYTSNTNPSAYSTHIRGDFTSSIYKETADAFDPAYMPNMQKKAEVIEPVDFTGHFPIKCATSCNNDSTIESSQTIRDTKYYRNLTIRGNRTALKFEKNMYVKGNLNINSTLNKDSFISIDGKRIYVEGNVTINNVNLQANFTLYAKGNISIREVTISGIKERNIERGSMIVFSDGNFQLSNISEYQDTPSSITGFFYSSGTMQLYGFGSNTTIIGGVAGENVVLNAMRGRAKEKLSDWPTTSGETTEQQCRFAIWSPGSEWYRVGLLQWCRDVVVPITNPIPYQVVSSNYYDTAANQAKLASRLQIIYNEELLNVFRNTIDYSNSVIFPENVLVPAEIELEFGGAP